MIIGILLGVSLAMFITSFIFVISDYAGALQENLITGAVIGPDKLASYSFIVLILSFILIVFFILLLKKRFARI
jgi:hypothetical protein